MAKPAVNHFMSGMQPVTECDGLERTCVHVGHEIKKVGEQAYKNDQGAENGQLDLVFPDLRRKRLKVINNDQGATFGAHQNDQYNDG